MARISSTQQGGQTLVRVRGRLTASDMGRLERACSPALVSAAARLSIDLRAVTGTDATAIALLERLASRGAVLTMSSQSRN